MNSEADQYFRSFRRLNKPEQYKDFTLSQVVFSGVHSKYPKQATVKEYQEVSGSAMKEVSMLLELETEPCSVVKYLHHILSQGRLFVFLEYCPKILTKEIAARKRNREFWSSPEILLYLRDMLQTLKTLHIKRIVHRNISPSSILLRDDTMKLAHFQDSKQIHVGLTMELSSMHGFDTFLSPQHYQALVNGQQGVTYESTYKDDVWSLGRTFYDMMTLKHNDDNILLLYDEGERGFAICLERELTSLRYSPTLVAIIVSMLALDHESRPDASRLFEQVQSALFALERCETCGQFEGMAEKLISPCEHSYCEGCVRKMVGKALEQDGTLESLRCAACSVGICAQIEREVTNVQLRAQLDMLRLNNQVRCANESCERMHSQLHLRSGRAKAYLVTCECGAKYCSYCHCKGGHGLFGVLSKCPQVPLVC